MSQTVEPPRAVPAQLELLAIYNPSLGSSDETLRDQIVYYYARDKSTQRAGLEELDQSQCERDNRSKENEKNEQLRQVGLAQGMVDFAKNFSNGVNVDTIDTEKSRIVLHEIETGWWILASVELTQLSTKKNNQEKAKHQNIEYSAREVSPAKLLITELIQAHSIFLLHHGKRLSELFERSGREVFCRLMERYWHRFVKSWDVLLHGNPATTMYNCTKLAGGGELGVGVGEEEWGSGEREVLEGFMDRTEGLIDLVVGRYGETLPERKAANPSNPNQSPNEVNLWLGSGNDTSAADGIIFTGRGALSKYSIRSVSQWMESIYKHGTRAYGIGENPSSRPRQSRKKPKVAKRSSDDSASITGSQGTRGRLRSPQGSRPADLRRKAIENNATPPGIPAPLVGQVERSLDEAITKASQQRGEQNIKGQSKDHDEAPSFGVDNMMKYLTLGYGSSWTLNPNGLNKEKSSDKRHSAPSAQKLFTRSQAELPSAVSKDERDLQEIDPTPEVSDDDTQPFQQRLEQSIGTFLVGLSGDLEEGEVTTDDEAGDDDGISNNPLREHRIILRTLILEMAKPVNARKTSAGSAFIIPNRGSFSSGGTAEEPKTSAAASIDGPQPNITHEKVQVAIYAHQPFIFVFLFALHTPNLTIPGFYRSIHNQLGPLQKPLLQSTDPARVAQRIADALNYTSSPVSKPQATGNIIHDIIYDPGRLTVRTSIPNIPLPGSLVTEGTRSQLSSFTVSGSWYTLGIPIGSSSGSSTPQRSNLIQQTWTRVEALSVHTQILNTFRETRNNTAIEYTAKTGRGWWVLWMKVAPRGEYSGKREAILVRKSPDLANVDSNSRKLSSGPGKWLLRDQPRNVSNGSSTNGGSSTAKGVSDAVGVDARKWVEALLHLTQ